MTSNKQKSQSNSSTPIRREDAKCIVPNDPTTQTLLDKGSLEPISQSLPAKVLLEPATPTPSGKVLLESLTPTSRKSPINLRVSNTTSLKCVLEPTTPSPGSKAILEPMTSSSTALLEPTTPSQSDKAILEPMTSSSKPLLEPTTPSQSGKAGSVSTKKTKEIPNLDDIITLLGIGPGTFHYLFAVAFFGVTTVFGALSTQFIAPTVDFNCTQPHGWPIQGNQCELPISMIVNSSLGNVHRYPKSTKYSPVVTPSDHQTFDDQDQFAKEVSSIIQSQGMHYSSSSSYPSSSSSSSPSSSTSKTSKTATSFSSGFSPSSAGMVTCTSFSYQSDVFQLTLTADFDLVCARAWMRPLFQLAFTSGCTVGAVLCAALSNRFGRQTVVWWSSLTTSLLIICVGAVPEMMAVTVARFFIGVLSPFIVCTSFTLGLEVCPKKHRVVYSSLIALPYALTLLLLTAVAYSTREWRVVQMMGLVGCWMQCILLSPCFLVESPLWLVSEGRLQEAEANIRNIAKKNNTSYQLPSNLPHILAVNYERQVKLESSLHTPRPGSMLVSLVSTATMRRVFFTTVTASFSLGVLYMAIPLRAGEFRSPFLYATFMGVCELPGYACFGYIVTWFGRRRASLCCCITLAIVEAVLMAMEIFKYDYEMVELVLSGLAFFLLISHYQVNFSQCSSLFPTHVRNLGSSSAYFFCTLGWNVPALSDLILPGKPTWLPLLLNTFLAALCGLLVLLMPDTTDAPLYQTVREYVQAVENKRQETRKKSLVISVKDLEKSAVGVTNSV